MTFENDIQIEKEETNSLNSYNHAKDPPNNSITMPATPTQDAIEMTNPILHGGVGADIKGKIQAVRLGTFPAVKNALFSSTCPLSIFRHFNLAMQCYLDIHGSQSCC